MSIQPKPKVKVLCPGTSKWAEVRAVQIVAAKYAMEVEQIQQALMLAFADGYALGREDAKRS